MPEARRDPYLNFNFLVQIDGDTVAGFREADLPEARIEVAAYREGNERPNTVRRLPGRVEYGPLVLRRGFAGDRTLFQWWRDVADGNLDRRNVVIILRDQSGRDVARWAFRDALPTKYSGPSFRAQGNEVAIESIELAVESMELEQ
ncbi:MAG: phage tail protein [Actinobacteria bacterium]|jgi:phage tail-like protein|nr:MAG: phage tail protein [Actinomycetota bacterium]